MQHLRRAVLAALVVFLPIFGLLWMGAPWSTSQADFELTGRALFDEVRASFSDPMAEPATWHENVAWLQSEEAAEIVLGQLPSRQMAALVEAGDTWDVRLWERMRALPCFGPFDTWKLDGSTICSWFDEQLKPKSPIDQLELVNERLSVDRSDDGQQINIAFRAADRDIATTIVDSFGSALLKRQGASIQEWRHRVVERIEAELAALTRQEPAPEASLSDRKSPTAHKEKASDFALMAKFMDAMDRAKEELHLTDRQRLSRELEAVRALARDELLGEATDAEFVDVTVEHGDEGLVRATIGSLTLLSHPDWSKPPVVRLSETTSDGFSVWEVAAIALIISFLIGGALSRFWPNSKRQLEQRNDLYASPYANPHWPNMRNLEETEPGKVA